VGAIEPVLPTDTRGVGRVDDRRVRNGKYWCLRTGSVGRLRARYGRTRRVPTASCRATMRSPCVNVVTDRNLDRRGPTRRLAIFTGHDDLHKTGTLRQLFAPLVDLVGMNIRTARNIRNRRTGRERRQDNRPFCSELHRRRRSTPVISSVRDIPHRLWLRC
jgi:hypothetical protein